jgi:pimeloyl-ACP methyl ester carboxylesterase
LAKRRPLLLLPGLNTTARLYEAQIDALADIADPTVADLTRHDTVAALAADVLAEAPGHFALAGLSMGGYVAFEIMRQAPGRVERLALLDTQARPDTPESTAKRRRLVELAEAGDFETALALLAWTDLVATTRASDDSLEAIIYGMGREVGPEAFVRQEEAIIGRPDSRPLLPGIACPTLVLVGDDDRITPPPLAREMAEAIPCARLVVVEDCGHLSALERPAAVNAALRDWLVS